MTRIYSPNRLASLASHLPSCDRRLSIWWPVANLLRRWSRHHPCLKRSNLWLEIRKKFGQKNKPVIGMLFCSTWACSCKTGLFSWNIFTCWLHRCIPVIDMVFYNAACRLHRNIPVIDISSTTQLVDFIKVYKCTSNWQGLLQRVILMTSQKWEIYQ